VSRLSDFEVRGDVRTPREERPSHPVECLVPTIEMPAVTRHLARLSRGHESDIARFAGDLECFARETLTELPAVIVPDMDSEEAIAIQDDWVYESEEIAIPSASSSSTAR
jgi:hypothetical protein